MRKIAIFTGSRAEYGLQYPILRAIADDERLEYFLLAGGTHLAEDFGRTLDEIEADGFEAYQQVCVPVRPPSPGYTAQSIADVVQSVSCILAGLSPDVLVVYGDRFESFAALIAATQMNIATAHIEGGDYTEGGALDDSVRHAMTKLAHLHFTTNARSEERVMRLGEESWRVFNVGLPTLDLAREGRFAQPEELIEDFGLDVSRPVVLFCQHPMASDAKQALEQFRPSLLALAELVADGFQVIVTYPNNDAGGEAMAHEIKRFEECGLRDVHVVTSLGRSRFHGMLHLMGNTACGVLAGNSSAGVKESRAFGCPCVNIGSRQRGRLRAGNVLDTGYDADAISAAIRKAVGDAAFRAYCHTCENPYGEGKAGDRISEILATIPIDTELLRKKMTF